MLNRYAAGVRRHGRLLEHPPCDLWRVTEERGCEVFWQLERDPRGPRAAFGPRRPDEKLGWCLLLVGGGGLRLGQDSQPSELLLAPKMRKCDFQTRTNNHSICVCGWGIVREKEW